MTKEVYMIRHNREKRRRDKLRRAMNIGMVIAWYVLLMPFAFYDAYVSRGYEFKIGGEWLLLLGFFLVRVIIKGFIEEWKEFKTLL